VGSVTIFCCICSISKVGKGGMLLHLVKVGVGLGFEGFFFGCSCIFYFGGGVDFFLGVLVTELPSYLI
jgi:hypothetical protein